MSTSELACTYAALILHDDDVPVTVRDETRTNRNETVEDAKDGAREPRGRKPWIRHHQGQDHTNVSDVERKRKTWGCKMSGRNESKGMAVWRANDRRCAIRRGPVEPCLTVRGRREEQTDTTILNSHLCEWVTSLSTGVERSTVRGLRNNRNNETKLTG